MSTFTDFLESENEGILVAEITAYDGSSSVTRRVASKTVYYSDNLYEGLILEDTEIERTMGAGPAWGSASGAQINSGELVLANAGDLDSWLDDFYYGQTVVMYYGRATWSYTTLTNNGKIFEGRIEDVVFTDTVVRFTLRGKHLKLSQNPIQTIYETTGTVIGDLRPLCYGYPKNIAGVITDSDTTPEYRVHEFGEIEDVAVTRYINQKAVTSPSVTKRNNLADIEFSAEPAGLVTFDTKGIKSGGSHLILPGECLEHMLTRTVPNAVFLASGAGTSTTVDLPDSASASDDEYNGLEIEKTRFSEDGVDTGQKETISDYDGGNRRVTIDTTWTDTPEDGDGLEIEGYTSQAGPLTSSDLDSSSFTQLDTDLPYDIGMYIDQEQTAEEVLEAVLGPGAFYAWKRDATLTVGIIEDPSSGTSVLTLNKWDTTGEMEIELANPRVYRLRVGYDRNFTVERGSTDDVSPSRAAYVTKEYRYHIKEDKEILDNDPEARELEVNTLFIDGADARTERDRLWTLFSSQRHRYIITAVRKALQLELGDIVTLNDDRYSLSSTKLLVIRMIERPLTGTVELVLWG